jgi:hypothetical protein
MEGGGTRPTLETLEKLAGAVGAELVVGVGEKLSCNKSIAKLVRDGHAVIRNANGQPARRDRAGVRHHDGTQLSVTQSAESGA